MDYNATTPLEPEVVQAVTEAMREAWGNPSSPYPAGNSRRCAQMADTGQRHQRNDTTREHLVLNRFSVNCKSSCSSWQVFFFKKSNLVR